LKEYIFSSALCALSLSTIGKRPQALAYLEQVTAQHQIY